MPDFVRFAKEHAANIYYDFGEEKDESDECCSSVGSRGGGLHRNKTTRPHPRTANPDTRTARQEDAEDSRVSGIPEIVMGFWVYNAR